MNFKKSASKIVRVIISMTIKLEDLDLDNILIGEKSHGNILSMTFHIKLSLI